jgi:hypothetical protein
VDPAPQIRWPSRRIVTFRRLPTLPQFSRAIQPAPFISIFAHQRRAPSVGATLLPKHPARGSSENRVSATLSQESIDRINQAIATIRQELSFLIDLSPEERQGLPKMGDQSRAFVQKALDLATQASDFLPRSFDVEEMRKDVALLLALRPILVQISQLAELLDDTELEVGSEAYVAALIVYRYAKQSGQGAALDGLIDELGKRFARKERGSGAAPTK